MDWCRYFLHLLNRINMIRFNNVIDTIMVKLNQKEIKIITIFLRKTGVPLQSSDVHDEIASQGEDISLVTV